MGDESRRDRRAWLNWGAWTVALAAVAVGCDDPQGYYRYADGDAAPGATGAAGGLPGAGGSAVGGEVGSAGAAPGFSGAPGGAGTTGVAGASGTAGISGASGASGAAGVAGNGPVTLARLSDDFEAGTAKDWIADATNGDWAVVAIDGNEVYEDRKSTSTLSWTIGGEIIWVDQVVQTKLELVSFSSSSAMVYLAARYHDVDSYYFVALKADGSLKLRKRVAGSTSDLAAYKSQVPLVAGTWYTLALSAVGTTLTVTWAGAAVAMATDADLQAGGIALGTQSCVAAFDDVSVTPPP